MADLGDFGQFCTWTATAHPLPGFARQQVGFGAAHDQGRATHPLVVRPEVDRLAREGSLERLGNTRIIAEAPGAVGIADDAVLGQVPPLPVVALPASTPST